MHKIPVFLFLRLLFSSVSVPHMRIFPKRKKRNELVLRLHFCCEAGLNCSKAFLSFLIQFSEAL